MTREDGTRTFTSVAELATALYALGWADSQGRVRCSDVGALVAVCDDAEGGGMGYLALVTDGQDRLGGVIRLDPRLVGREADAWVYRIGADPEHRHHGLGRQSVRFPLDRVKVVCAPDRRRPAAPTEVDSATNPGKIEDVESESGIGGRMTTLAVVIPSRLQPDPATGTPYLYGAVQSVLGQWWPKPGRQDWFSDFLTAKWHLVLALDPSQGLLEELTTLWGLQAGFEAVTVVNAPVANQASAVNAGMDAAAALGVDYIAHLEDDDLWSPHHLRQCLWALREFDADFVSSSSELFSDLKDAPQGHVATSGVFHFPIASTWVLKAEVWKAVGHYDPEFRVHPDNDWLGRLNALERFRRVHLVEPGLCPPWDERGWLANVANVSWLAPAPQGLSVRRRVQAGSVLARNSAERSNEEYGRLQSRYGDLARCW